MMSAIVRSRRVKFVTCCNEETSVLNAAIAQARIGGAFCGAKQEKSKQQEMTLPHVSVKSQHRRAEAGS